MQDILHLPPMTCIVLQYPPITLMGLQYPPMTHMGHPCLQLCPQYQTPMETSHSWYPVGKEWAKYHILIQTEDQMVNTTVSRNQNNILS